MKRINKVPNFGECCGSGRGGYCGLHFIDLCRMELSANIIMNKPAFDMLLPAAQRRHPLERI
jgi:hypothetical protein